jgi:basic membrane lipoprotein Med (substrate-binding protein (PBP1-ABC) superfamily)
MQPENAFKARDALAQLAQARGADARIVGHGMDMSDLDGLENHTTRMLTSAQQAGDE